MTDLSNLSDDELKALYGKTAAPQPATDLSKLSDADLLALHQASQPAAEPSMTADIAKSGGIGLAKGAIGMAGAAGDARNLLSAASDYLGKTIGASPEAVQTFKNRAYDVAQYLPGLKVMSQAPSSADIQKGIEGVTGDFYKPKTTAGEYAQTIGEFAPAAVGGEGSALARILGRVALPAVVSETAGQLTKGTEAEPYARVLGAMAAPASLSAARRVVTPFPAEATRTDLANVLANEGVQMTAGQRTGNRPLQWAESVLGDTPFAGGRPGEIARNQQEQFTAAALRRAGETADRATPEVVNHAFDRIGNQFDAIGARNYVAPDQQFINDIVGVRDDYHNLVGPHARAPVVENTINDIANQMGRSGGVLNGDQYNAMTSRIGRQARNAKADPQLQTALQGIKDSLDDAFERTLQTTGNTADLDALLEARRQYRNLLVIEKAATGAGSNTAEGLLSPSQLKGAVVQQNRRGYARGQGDFADLARAGEAILRPLPQSGTGPRTAIQHLLTLGGAAAGGPEGGLAALLSGVVGPAIGGRLIMSRPVQAYLGNQFLQPAAAGARGSALARALIAGEVAGVPQQLLAPAAPGDAQRRLAGP